MRRKLSSLNSPRRARHRGAALVEFALVVGVLLALVMGIIEFAVFCKNSLTIANATREGARTASLGRTVENIRQRVKVTAQPLRLQDSDITLTYSAAGGAYSPLGNNATGSQNNATTDNLVRVSVEIQNTSVTGAFGALFNRPIGTAVTMRRERSSNS